MREEMAGSSQRPSRPQQVQIVDAHITQSEGRRQTTEQGRVRAWTENDPSRYRPDDLTARAEVLIERYLAAMTATGVSAMILQGPSMLSAAEADPTSIDAGASPSLEAVMAGIVARRHPDRFAYWLRVDHKTNDLEGVVREARRRANCVAVRCIVVSIHDPDQKGVARFKAGGFEPLFKAAAAEGVPLNLFAPYHLSAVPGIVERYPDLVLTLDHLGLPVRPYMSEPEAFGHLPQLLALAKHPNVAVKLSGAEALSEEGYPFRDLHEPLRKIIEAFGPERCIWASDYTRCLPLHTLGEAVAFWKYGAWLTDAERRMILAGSARRRYAWPRN